MARLLGLVPALFGGWFGASALAASAAATPGPLALALTPAATAAALALAATALAATAAALAASATALAASATALAPAAAALAAALARQSGACAKAARPGREFGRLAAPAARDLAGEGLIARPKDALPGPAVSGGSAGRRAWSLALAASASRESVTSFHVRLLGLPAREALGAPGSALA